MKKALILNLDPDERIEVKKFKNAFHSKLDK